MLLVNIPLARFGSTNNGNMARKFFREPKKSWEITNIPQVLIRRHEVIMTALSCCQLIDLGGIDFVIKTSTASHGALPSDTAKEVVTTLSLKDVVLGRSVVRMTT